MAENVLKLKKEAIRLGMAKSDARTATRSVLENFISSAGKNGVAKKKAATTAKKKAAPAKAKKTATTAKKTRPKSAPAAKKSATTGKAKRPAAARKNTTNGSGGRHLIGSLDFSVEDGWNPREGSPVAVIFKALKKARGNVDKTFDALKGDVRDFVSTKKADGTKRTKDEMLAMLRYRINRTRFQFALQTGQHESSTDRVQYGTGDYATVRKVKPKRTAKRTTAKAKPNTRKPGKKAAATRRKARR